ncbi:MAG: hypothetical protein WB852_02045 [Thermoplasmata archaeon]
MSHWRIHSGSEQVRMKPKNQAGSRAELAVPEDDKMSKIVDEVDRFFKSVHADIEDWKFSMEDYGDGTRIFVRFQIHFDQSVVSRNPKTSKETGRSQGETTAHRDMITVHGGRVEPEGREDMAVLPDPEGAGAAQRADLDLASFVDLWRRKRDSSLHGEYHKKGAPHVDAQPEGNGRKRTRDDVSPDGNDERTHEEPKVPDART